MTADQIKHMTERFLSWKLPSSFAPDGGVARTERFSEHTSGTNVFDYMQAQAMIQHMLEGLPSNHIVNFENEVDYIGVKMESPASVLRRPRAVVRFINFERGITEHAKFIHYCSSCRPYRLRSRGRLPTLRISPAGVRRSALRILWHRS